MINYERILIDEGNLGVIELDNATHLWPGFVVVVVVGLLAGSSANLN